MLTNYNEETWSRESRAGLDSMHENRKGRPKAEDRWLCKSERTHSEAENQKPRRRWAGKARKPKAENQIPKSENPKPNPEETLKKLQRNPSQTRKK